MQGQRAVRLKGKVGGGSAYCFRWLGLDDEFVLLQVFEGDLHVCSRNEVGW